MNTDFCIGDWIVRPQRDCIERGGKVVRLAPKAMAVLQCLARTSGEVVSRRELFDTIWPGGEVTDDALAQRIVELRRAFGDSAHQARFIETIPKIGFRLIPSVTPLTDEFDRDPQSHGYDALPNTVARTAIFIASTIVVVVSLSWYLVSQRGSQEAVTAGEIPSIAVLPFVNMSDDASNEYFSDGISEELLSLLAKIPELRVISRTSAFSYKDKDIDTPTIAEQLNVANILEGSVRKVGNQVRITAQLIDARSDSHLWSETYERTLDDVFAIQDEISSAVVDALKVTLLSTVPHASEISPEAYTLYLQAQHLSNQGRLSLFQNAVDLYEQVLELEPGYAPAWVGISRNYSNMTVVGHMAEVEGFQMAVDAVEMALQLDPNLAEAHSRRGRLYIGFEQDPLNAAVHFGTAMELNPNDPVTLMSVAHFAASLGKFETSIRLAEDAVLRDSVNAILRIHLGDYYRSAERFDDAVKSFKIAKNLNPEIAAVHYKLASVLLAGNDPEAALAEFLLEPDEEFVLKGRALSFHALNRTEEFEASLIELRDRYGEQWPSEVAHVYAWTGNHDAAFELLDKAVAINEIGLGNSRQVLWLKPLHNDPRWQVYLERVGVSDKQITAIDFAY